MPYIFQRTQLTGSPGDVHQWNPQDNKRNTAGLMAERMVNATVLVLRRYREYLHCRTHTSLEPGHLMEYKAESMITISQLMFGMLAYCTLKHTLKCAPALPTMWHVLFNRREASIQVVFYTGLTISLNLCPRPYVLHNIEFIRLLI